MTQRALLRGALKSAHPAVQAVMRSLSIYPLRFLIRFLPWPKVKLLLFDSCAEHLWWLETHVDAKTVFGSAMRVDASDIVGKHLYYFGVWEPNLTGWVRRSLEAGQVFIDVGSNIGYYSLLASKLVGKTGRVIAIEALPETFQRLRANLDLNDAANVRSINSAAWDRKERLKIFVRQEGASGATTLMSAWADQWQLRRQVEIEAEPLATLLTDSEIENARVIKVDVEGAEWHVISEMTSWLHRTAPDLEIAIELSRSMMTAQGKSFKDILTIFNGFGFHAYRIRNDYLASSCVAWENLSEPKRIFEWPGETVDQIDVIFSRTDAIAL